MKNRQGGSTARITIKHVASKAGVSLGTVSRVLNGNKSVGDELRIRVERAIRELEYHPDVLAQSMRRGATRVVGVVIRSLMVPVLAGFVKAAQDVLHEAGYAVMLAGSEGRPERELEILSVLSRRRMDGVIMTTASEADPTLLRARQALQMPVVLLDRHNPADFDAVLVAHREGVRRAVEHLLDLGHRRIALITGEETTRPAVERVRGYHDAYRARGFTPDPRFIRTQSFSADFGFVETSSLMGQNLAPTAIIAGGIAMLPGVLRAARAHSLRVPDDLSIIGSCDSDLAQMMTPPITVVQWDYEKVGKVAAELLVGRIERERDAAPRHVRFPAELVIRGSCAAPR